ncbi:carbohydrate ABC transporter permease [Natrononativus amylolyticus]|uniref:carbohydrate ABC transporter permease n=1 Tax=Natrononativus amylolyticus TaxID=2963434 RepID=UPI0020CCF886|nr:sugar ABC transporter permease [Natrononativus amylolyticus]
MSSLATLQDRVADLRNGELELSRYQRRTLIAWVVLTPLVTWLILYKYIAFLYNIVLSFHERSRAGDLTFLGLDNWAALASDPVFPTALMNTILFFLAVPVAIAIALGIALLLNRRFPGVDVFRAIFFLPYITMMVAVAVIWQYIFSTDYGVLNYFLLELGLISDNISWLGRAWYARLSIFMIQVWTTVGFFMLIILAGLQSIPQQVYEVASIDGASRYQKFRYITLPLLKPTLGICALVGMASTFRLFDVVMVMTGGGPGNSTEILLTWIYKQSFNYNDFGYGAVLSIIMVAITLIIAFGGYKLQTEQYT